MNKSEVFAELRKRGVNRVVVPFSGGGDEGGCDHIALFRDQEEVGRLQEEYDGETYDSATQKWVRKPLSGDAALTTALCAPVYGKYHTFAGEFSVQGEVIWDVDAGTVKMNGKESIEHYEDFEDDI